MKKLIPIALLIVITTVGITAQAAVPTSLNYQAYLTDRDGSPQSGNTLMTFSLYAVEVGGSPLWFDTLNIDIEHGLVSVELGRSANPFPLDLFETPLWLGIAVEADAEMIPRRALTSVGFSFKADDADRLQGKTSAELDQSFHVDDQSNPHAVTAGQAGAVEQAALDAHSTDTSNPHDVIAAQTGAVDGAVFSAHTSDQAAHHARYANSEAVSAMGIEDRTNPLNHARYGDAESVSAVLAADGDGSGLDSDLVDGMEAQEIIEAAGAVRLKSGNIEVGILIDWIGDIRYESFNFTLLTSKEYLVTGMAVVVSDPPQVLLETKTIHFLSNNCTGQAYVETELFPSSPDSSWLARQGGLWRTDLPGGGFQDFYVPKGTLEWQSITSESAMGNGTCSVSTSTILAYPAFPNDPAVTGFLNNYPDPLVVGR